MFSSMVKGFHYHMSSVSCIPWSLNFNYLVSKFYKCPLSNQHIDVEDNRMSDFAYMSTQCRNNYTLLEPRMKGNLAAVWKPTCNLLKLQYLTL
jgi:hypothetical protein